MPNTEPQEIDLDKIRTEPAAGVRDASSAEYAEGLVPALDSLPPVVVFYDGTDYWLGDGVHRILATHLDGRTTIRAVVREGSKDDAVWFSLSANASHGLRLSAAEKRRSVATALQHPEGCSLSNSAISKLLGVSTGLVASVRDEIDLANGKSTVRRGLDGRSINVTRIGGSRRETEDVPLDAIDLDRSIHGRVEMTSELVEDLADILRDGCVPPPVELMRDGDGTCYIVDGWHRVAAYRAAGRTAIPGVVTPGDKRDAKRAAWRANHDNGMRSSHEVRRKIVRLAIEDTEYSAGLSDRELAKRCGVSPSLVSQIRHELGGKSPYAVG